MDKLCVVAFVQLLLCINVSLAQNATLQGMVVRKIDSAGIENVLVFIDSSYLSAYTSHSGTFQIKNLETGEHTVSFSHVSYERESIPIKLEKGINKVEVVLDSISDCLAQIVITGTGTSHSLDSVPVQTEIITQNDLKEISSSSLEDIISNLSSSFDFTSSSMGTSVKINGLGKDYVLILVNGKRMSGSNGGYVDLNRINTEEIEQIEIIKGATSTLYGSDAMAGVINIITKKPKKEFSVSNSSRFGAYNQLRQQNSISFTKNKFSSKTSLSYTQTDGWQLNSMEYNSKWKDNHELPYLVPTYDMPVNKKRDYTINQSISIDASNKLNINADASWYEKRLFFPFRGRNYNYHYYNTDIVFSAKYKLSKSSHIEISGSFADYLYYTEYPNKYNESYITPEGTESITYYPGDRFKNSENISTIVQAKGVFEKGQHTLNVGSEIYFDYLEAQYRLINEKVHASTYSLYVQDEYKIFEEVNLVGGVRFIYHEKFGFIATPKIAGLYKLGKFAFRLNYANGFKTPTLKELYYFYESDRMGIYSLYLGNENLKPQRSNYYSASAEYKIKRLKTSATVYLNSLKDMIEYKIIETSYEHSRRGIEETNKRYNILQAQNLGGDVSFDCKIGKQLNAACGYSYVDARDISKDIRLNGVSEHSATWKLTWKKGWESYGLNITLSGTYKSDRFYLEEDTVRSFADPYHLWKLTTTHKFDMIKNCNVDFIAGIDNIFNYVDNRPYGSHYGTLNPGRTLFVGLKMKFKKNKTNI